MATRVHEAILKHFRLNEPSSVLRTDRPDYTTEPSANLVPGLSEQVLEDFAAGSGAELEGDTPKFCAVHSSSALAANSFGPMRLHPSLFGLAGVNGFGEAQFEKKLPTGLLGIPPNLDFFARGPVGVVAVESKFTEILSRKRAKFAASYAGAIERLAEPAWAALYESLVADPNRFHRLDAAQLVKHYLGIRHSLAGAPGDVVLVYAYWEPRNGAELSEFSVHRAEVAEFVKAVGGSSVRFVAVTHTELWDEWETSSPWPHITDHVGALRARYEVTIQPPAT